MARNTGLAWALGGGVIGLAGLVIGAAVALRPSASAPAERLRIDDAAAIMDVAWDFVQQGRADRLPELIHPESPEMESVLARLGRLLGALQELADAVGSRFPDEVARVRAAAASNQGVFFNQARRSAQDGPDERFLATVFADPYGWLETARRRVSVVYVADDVRAVTVDGAPAFGVGLTLRQFDDGWRFVFPTSLPMIRRFMPQTLEEWQIVASMVTVLENAIRDLTADVTTGRARNLDDAARLAGEKAWIPLVMTVVAYQKAMESRSR